MTNYDFYEKGNKGLFEAQLTDLFPDQSVETQCLSYALYVAMQRIKKYTERLVFRNNLDNLPEDILDYLAYERSLPFYDGSMDLQAKRNLIQSSFLSCQNRGTVQMVEDLIQNIFRTGTVVEWFDFPDSEQTPGLFDVEVDETSQEQTFEKFKKVLKNAKNEGRHMRKLGENHDTRYSLQGVSRTYLTEHILVS